MKAKYRLFRRGKIFYAENATTGKQQSLHTSDTQEAKRLIAAKNEAVNNAQLTLAVGKAYLAVTDPEMLTRTWFEVIGFANRQRILTVSQSCQPKHQQVSVKASVKISILNEFALDLTDEKPYSN